MKYRFISIILFIATSLLLINCSPTGAILTAGSSIGRLALEERDFKDSIKDRLLALRVLKDLTAHDSKLFLNLSVDVVAGTALITGVVSDQETRAQAIKIAYRVPNIEKVVNEIQLSDTNLLSRVQDEVIEVELETKIALDQQIRSINYVINVYDGTVIIFGLARSENELERIKQYARNIANVRNIVEHVDVAQG